MIISLKQALRDAKDNRIAIAAVNVPYFEGLVAAVKVAERAKVPMILQHAQKHEELMPMEEIGPVMRLLAERSENPFVLHVDHATDIDYIANGIDLGFNSAMFDGSLLSLEENVQKTAEVVKLGRRRGFDVEGELGVLSGDESGIDQQSTPSRAIYTDVLQARDFVERTGVVALAAAFGTEHGIYHQAPVLNYDLMRDLSSWTGAALVMHGGSGLSPAQYRLCIAHGVRKINYYTYAAKAAADAILRKDRAIGSTLFPNLALEAIKAVEQNVSNFVKIVSEATTG